jgi:hypothetical protein
MNDNYKILKGRKNKIILFNPRSASHNHRLPLSILQIGASVFGKEEFVFIDGNLEKDPWGKIAGYLSTGEFVFFASTVMPGPQLKQAIGFTKAIREKFPEVITIWGGYFPSLHYRVCMESGLIDYIIRGPGDVTFPKLIRFLREEKSDRLPEIGNLVYRLPGNQLAINPIDPVPDQDSLPRLPFDYLEQFYPLEKYIAKTFMGDRTLSYHSSIGCPYACGFCGVASVYNSTWKGKSAGKMADDILEYKSRYGIDAIEFHDSNFFCSHSRTIEFCKLMKGQNIRWWAEGRVDTMGRYSDEELQLIRDSGCCLVFMGAESGNDDLLGQMNKGSTFQVNNTVEIVRKFRQFDIIPQLSFVLGVPDKSPRKMIRQIHDDIHFIRSLKELNPQTELVLYLFSPVPSEDSALSGIVRDYGFRFPASLDDWTTSEWEDFDLRRGKGMPWLRRSMIRLIRDFEVVMMSAYPSITNFQINRFGKTLLRIPGRVRYKLRWYKFPYGLKALLRLLSYRRPEKEGFYST